MPAFMRFPLAVRLNSTTKTQWYHSPSLLGTYMVPWWTDIVLIIVIAVTGHCMSLFIAKDKFALFPQPEALMSTPWASA